MWERISKLVDVDIIDVALRHAVEELCTGQLMGELTTATLCCLTRSTAIPRLGSWGPPAATGAIHDRVDILFPRHLVVAHADRETRQVHARSARLDSVMLGPSLPALDSVVADFGVSVTAQWCTHGGASSCWVGLGADPDGHIFLDRLRDAVGNAAHRPRAHADVFSVASTPDQR